MPALGEFTQGFAELDQHTELLVIVNSKPNFLNKNFRQP